MEDEKKYFVGQKIENIREAFEDEKIEILGDKDFNDEPLMVAELENGSLLYLFSEEDEDDNKPIAVGQMPNGEVIEITKEDKKKE